jgi:hypothetical protein
MDLAWFEKMKLVSLSSKAAALKNLREIAGCDKLVRWCERG